MSTFHVLEENLQIWIKEYANQLENACMTNPDEYPWYESKRFSIEQVVDKVEEVVRQGQFPSIGTAFKKTAKALSIRPTHQALKEFLTTTKNLPLF
jgi:hypothetical protein